MKFKALGFTLLTLLLIYGSITKSDNTLNEVRASDEVVIKSVNVDKEVENLEEKADKLVKEESLIESKSETYTLNLKMVGDNLIHSPLYKAALQADGTYNFDMLFENIKSDIESADIAIINQETIFINDRSKYSGYPMFGSPIEVGDAIAKAGFDIVAHATNHTMDKGVQGINDTITFWEERHPDINYIGIHKDESDSDITYIEKNNIKLAFVNYTYGLNGLTRKGKDYTTDLLSDTDIEGTLLEAENNADFTVAVLHVGNEYVYKPTAYAIEQVDRFINNGADIVICAHPHVIEPYEMRITSEGKSGLVYYSLGNFISNQTEIPRVIGGMADINMAKTVDSSGETVALAVYEYDMIPLVTHQQSSYYTTYKLDDYTDELCKKHKLYRKGKFDKSYLENFFYDIVGNKTNKE